MARRCKRQEGKPSVSSEVAVNGLSDGDEAVTSGCPAMEALLDALGYDVVEADEGKIVFQSKPLDKKKPNG